MSKFIKLSILAICLSVIVFILLEKFSRTEYAYFEKKYKKEVVDGKTITTTYYKVLTQEEYNILKEKKKLYYDVLSEENRHLNEYEKINNINNYLDSFEKIKKFNSKALIFSIAVGIGFFTLMYKQNKKDE